MASTTRMRPRVLEGGQAARAVLPQVLEGGGGLPGSATTTAQTTSPQVGSGRPTTATSATAGVPGQHRLDLGGRHRLAPGADHVAGARPTMRR